MADMNNLHSPGTGHHHNHHHPTRPFSYVQPANQSLYTYQWNMNPYSQYGLSVSALPYMRPPFLAPYPYMSGCPAYVMPQAPMYPVDYRGMLNPHHYSAPPASDIHHYNIKRQTASSEVQTEQDDPLNKLIGSLERLSTNETPETDVVLNASDLCHEMQLESPSDKEVNRTASVCTPPEVSGPNSSLVDTSWASRSGAHTGESASHGSWSVGSGIDVLPLDSSSINGEDENVEDFSLETENVKGCEKLDSPNANPEFSSDEGSSGRTKNQSWDLTENLSEHKFLGSVRCLLPQFLHNQDQMLHHAGSQDIMICKGDLGAEPEKELPYRILRLPCDKVTTGMLEQEQSLWFIDPSTSSSLLPKCCDYYHSTIQGANERQSILSLSIDELSSKDEISADLCNDLAGGAHGLLSDKPVYTGGGKLAAETDYCSQDARLDFGEENHFQSVPLSFKRLETSLQICVCCGTSLQKKDELMGEMGGSLPNLKRTNEEVQQEGDEYQEDEELSEELFHMLPDHYPGVKTHIYPLYPPHHRPSSPYLYPRSRKMHDYEVRREGQEMGIPDEQQDHGYARQPEYCAPAPWTSKAEKFKWKRQRNGPPKTYNAWRERPATSDPDGWGSCGDKYKPRSSRPNNGMHEQVHIQHKRPSQKMWPDHDYKGSEESRPHKGRGSTKKRSTRC